MARLWWLYNQDPANATQQVPLPETVDPASTNPIPNCTFIGSINSTNGYPSPTDNSGQTHWYADAIAQKRNAQALDSCSQAAAQASVPPGLSAAQAVNFGPNYVNDIEYIDWVPKTTGANGAPVAAYWLFHKNNNGSGNIVAEFCKCATGCAASLPRVCGQ
jgi:hypothetical protein